jgi:undecaprenyl-diphosphatase
MQTARRNSQRTTTRPPQRARRVLARPVVDRGTPLARLIALDDRLLRRVVKSRKSRQTFALSVLCRLLDPDIVTLIVTTFVIAGEWLLAERLAIALVVVSTVVVIVKRTVRRARPSCDVQALAPPDRWSFPSGHTAAAFALAIALFGVYPFLAPVAVLGAILIGYARMYLGVHYPVDVLAGGAIGLFVGSCVALL